MSRVPHLSLLPVDWGVVGAAHPTVPCLFRAAASPACLAEIENHLHISDGTVAEFIVETAKEAGNVDKFKRVSGCRVS